MTVFPSSKKLRVHIKASHRQRFSCAQCARSYGRGTQLAAHVRREHGEGGARRRCFACPVEGCTKVYTRRGSLATHNRNVHLQLKPYACTEPGCTERYGYKHLLKRHVASQHGGPGPTFADVSFQARYGDPALGCSPTVLEQLLGRVRPPAAPAPAAVRCAHEATTSVARPPGHTEGPALGYGPSSPTSSSSSTTTARVGGAATATTTASSPAADGPADGPADGSADGPDDGCFLAVGAAEAARRATVPSWLAIPPEHSALRAAMRACEAR